MTTLVGAIGGSPFTPRDRASWRDDKTASGETMAAAVAPRSTTDTDAGFGAEVAEGASEACAEALSDQRERRG